MIRIIRDREAIEEPRQVYKNRQNFYIVKYSKLFISSDMNQGEKTKNWPKVTQQ